MTEELEALKYLKENKRRHWLDDDKSDECLKIIEEELARTEEYKHNHQVEMQERQSIFKALLKEKREHEFLSEHYNELLNECNKEHKALEIIKEKKVNVYNFCFYLEHHKNFTYEEYRKILDEHNEDLYDFYEITEFYKPGTELTQEEFDLLREVLKCGK